MAGKSHVLSLIHGTAGPRSPDSLRSNANEKSTSSLYFQEPMLQAGRLERLVKRSVGGGHTVTKWSARTATLTTGSLRLHEDQDSPDLDDEIRLLDIDVLEKNEGDVSTLGSDSDNAEFSSESVVAAGVSARKPPDSVSGFLWKKGKVNTAYQKRFFMLKNGSIAYYKEPTKLLLQNAFTTTHSFHGPGASADQAIGAQGIFKCVGMTVEINTIAGDAADPYRFDLLTSDGRRVELKAESDIDRRRWVDAIQDAARSQVGEADQVATDKPSSNRCFRLAVTKYKRNYILRAATEEERDQWLEQIQAAKEEAELALTRAMQSSPLRLLRKKATDVYESGAFQKIVGCIIVLNFVLNVADAEIAGMMREEEKGEDSSLGRAVAIFAELDLVFQVFYILELFLNLFVNWWLPFISDGWSVFDAFCVIIGLFGTVTGVSSAQVVRSIRILRIIRIFRRFKTLQNIVLAISKCVLKIFHTFLIIAIVLAIYSVMATQCFGWIDPHFFGGFSTSFMTMIQVMTGDGWMTDIVRPLVEAGKTTSPATVSGFPGLTMIFFFSFVLLVYVVLLNVTVSVLLEGFLSAMAHVHEDERLQANKQERAKMAHNLDPVLEVFATYSSPEHLLDMINRVFDQCDGDVSGALSFEEWKKGLESLPLHSENGDGLRLTKEDWDIFTCGRRYLNFRGDMDRENFVICMRLELNSYAHRKIAGSMNDKAKQGMDFSLLLAQKITMTNFHERRPQPREISLGADAPSQINLHDASKPWNDGNLKVGVEGDGRRPGSAVGERMKGGQIADAGIVQGLGTEAAWDHVGGLIDASLQARVKRVEEKMDRNQGKLEALLDGLSRRFDEVQEQILLCSCPCGTRCQRTLADAVPDARVASRSATDASAHRSQVEAELVHAMLSSPNATNGRSPAMLMQELRRSNLA